MGTDYSNRTIVWYKSLLNLTTNEEEKIEIPFKQSPKETIRYVPVIVSVKGYENLFCRQRNLRLRV